ncbi:MAG: hypothetical protein ACP5NQ_06860 [Vulcanisaeta sp.]
MGTEPITLINSARKDLQMVTKLLNEYERSRDVGVLTSIAKLGLLIFDNATKALLDAREIRVKDWGYVMEVIRYFVPNNVVSEDLRDYFVKCSSQNNGCDHDEVPARVNELSRFVDYISTVVTHRIPYRGL